MCIRDRATLAGRFGDSEYGRSKKAGEELFFQYARETGAKVAVYRFPNLMGHSRPKYNSAVSTFCWAVANDEEFTVNDRATELELLYIDDLIEGMFDLMEGKEQRCEFDGVDTCLLYTSISCRYFLAGSEYGRFTSEITSTILRLVSSGRHSSLHLFPASIWKMGI